MKLAYLSAAHAWVEGRTIYTFPSIGRTIEALAHEVGGLNVALSVQRERSVALDHRLTGPIRFFPLPAMQSIAHGVWRGADTYRAIQLAEMGMDASIVQLPFSAPTALLPQRIARVYHVCADVIGVVSASEFYRGPRRVAALGAAYGMDLCQRVLFHQPRTRVVTNGAALYESYGSPAGRPIVSATLRSREIDSVPRARSAEIPRVLFVGYLRPEKGLDILLRAYELLLARHPSIELRIVGTVDATERGAEGRLLSEVKRAQTRGHVELVGKREFGPALFQEFADADVLALPSRSEGTPRVLMEARAFRCPIVAAAVGGVPFSVTDGADGLLVPPEDPEALSRAIERVITDVSLRASLVENGLKRAAAGTLEVFARTLAEEARLACVASSR